MADSPLLTSGQRGGLRIVRVAAAATLTGLPAWWRAVSGVLGVLTVIASTVSRRAIERIGLIPFGLVSIVAAFVVLTFPGHSLVLLARMGGVILLIFGVASLLSVFAGRGQLSADAGAGVAAY